MSKAKSPLVKILRKAGFKTSDAAKIAALARKNYDQSWGDNLASTRHFNWMIVKTNSISSIFDWSLTEEGHNYWCLIDDMMTDGKPRPAYDL